MAERVTAAQLDAVRSMHQQQNFKQESQEQATLENDFFSVTKVDKHVHLVIAILRVCAE